MHANWSMRQSSIPFAMGNVLHVWNREAGSAQTTPLIRQSEDSTVQETHEKANLSRHGQLVRSRTRGRLVSKRIARVRTSRLVCRTTQPRRSQLQFLRDPQS